jgi:CheY-like chemotaxis protein/cytochrome c-type biogenesis protein CcmH/NrfG
MPATVLIVDDDRFTRNVLEALFAREQAFVRAGVKVVTADDGETGLVAFREHRPKVVISDLLMPRRDGFALCRAIRSEPGGGDVELLVSSGVYRDSTVKKQLDEELRATFFAKPYQVRELADEVAKRLGVTLDGPPRPKRRRPTPRPSGQERGGEIADRPIPRLMLQLLDERATGRLALRRGNIEKSAMLVLGHPTNATTNVREEILGHYLVGRGVITEAKHKRALELAATRNIRVGQALIDQGAITAEQLVEQLAAQTRFKLVQTLRWSEGRWLFAPAPEPTTTGEPLDVEHLVVHGLKQTSPLGAALELAERLHGIRLHLSERGHQLRERFERLLSPAFDRAWVDGATAAQLIARGKDRDDIATGIEALVTAQLLHEGAPVGVGATATAGADPRASAEVPSLAELVEESQTRQFAAESSGTNGLAGLLFDDLAEITKTGARPLDPEPENADAIPAEFEAGRDSGVIDVSDIDLSSSRRPRASLNENDQARRMLIEEYLRIQGLDHYAILGLPRDADPAAISAALTGRRTKYSPEWLSRFDLGRDYSKLEELHRAYEQARLTLLDDERRRHYDAELIGMAIDPGAPSLDAEVAFGAAMDALHRGDHPAALAKLAEAIELAPNEPDYHADHGWVTYLVGGRSVRAADAARPAINHALSLAPDHARAHEYKGIIGAALGTDDVEAIFHLERALERDPGRTEALDSLEATHRSRGELRPLERTYRKLIHRCDESGGIVELDLWRRLAALYVELDDSDNARIAYESALRIAPGDVGLRDALMDVHGGAADGFHERTRGLRQAWREAPRDPAPAMEMFRAALHASRFDAAFLAASALVARDQASDEAASYYRRYRPRFVVRAQRSLDRLWAQLRHADDDAEINELFDQLAPVYARVAPLDRSELEADETTLVPETELPRRFLDVARYVAGLLGVELPAVHLRPDFGRQIHVAAVAPPVLLAGEDALMAPEPFELGFRLGRAMTYLPPGRATGGSRPGTILKAGMLAALKSAVPTSRIDDPTGLVAEIAGQVSALPAGARERAHALVVAIARRSRSVNLSAWSRALGLTAARAGLLIAGDLPIIARYARETGPDDDLIDFCVSSEHLVLRGAVGLSVDV